MTRTQYGTWVSYGGAARIELAVVLLVIAGILAYAGTRLRRPARAVRPGRTAVVFMLATWVLSLVTFGVALTAYILQLQQAHFHYHVPADPIAPVTLLAALAIFVTILATGPKNDGVRLVSALVGAMAAPMIFELPFDLIVMARTYPPIPPHPALYRALFFLPLFLIEITTLWLLTLSPRMKVSKAAFLCLAAMFAVFAVWGLFGMAYPSAPIPIALNMVSKILAFATVLCLFLPLRTPASAPDP
ncbi:MAG: hypothetical protein M3Y33_12155 [Actinomycetota bacterium]|nr:hypothetical protein [Actinomycetota bacterium]